MVSETKNDGLRLDSVKLVVALLCVICGLAGFYLYADYSLLYRVLGLLAAVGIGIGIALQTYKGRHLLGYFHEAQLEVRKVVWPTREEAVQTTLIVIIMVILIAIILWVLDMFLGWSIGSLIGQHNG